MSAAFRRASATFPRQAWIRAELAYRPAQRPVGEGQDEPPLYLDANEGEANPLLAGQLAAALTADPGLLSRYPDTRRLESALAERYGLDPSRVVVCAGGDDAIQRVVSLCAPAASKVLVYRPAFPMYGIYAAIRGADLVDLPWLEAGAFPLAASLELIERCPSLALVCLASPANPLGAALDRPACLALAEACRKNRRNLLFDAAYEDFCDQAVSAELLDNPAVFVAGTFSKAWGLAGLRIGWVLAPDSQSAQALRAAGGPYPVSGLAILAALSTLGDSRQLAAMRASLRDSRGRLANSLRQLGFYVPDSQANFVLARGAGLQSLQAGLARVNIFIKIFAANKEAAETARITVPPNAAGLERLLAQLTAWGRINEAD